MDARIRLLSMISCALIASSSAAQSPYRNDAAVRPVAVYGDDDRVDLDSVRDADQLRLADSVVALFREEDVIFSRSGDFATLRTEPFYKPHGETAPLCEGERFRGQPRKAYCSGALVAPDLVMTAGHCVEDTLECTGTRIVFGFAVKNKRPGEPTRFASGDIHSCKAIVARESRFAGEDWALLRLDRPVSGHAPLPVSREGPPGVGSSIFMIGHPEGLPVKIAGPAVVMEDRRRGAFLANLDSFAINSGSPVFNAETGEIAGILAHGMGGESDYVLDDRRGCLRVKVLPEDSPRRQLVIVTDASIPGALLPSRPSSPPSRSFLKKPAMGPAYQQLLESIPL